MVSTCSGNPDACFIDLGDSHRGKPASLVGTQYNLFLHPVHLKEKFIVTYYWFMD